MTELQQARADYIAALEREHATEAECERLRQENYVLQQRLAFAECRATIMKSLYDGLVPLMFVTRS